ncbi:MAG TPA: DUF4019 domain-containing protein [Thermoanaerobaculia bacterium]|nr:DUF4019 domain-containing protein [Thermoanaerobaculia bacterium]
MKKRPIGLCVLALTLCVLAPVVGGADEGASQKAAGEAARSWLGLVDSGNYAESWSQAAQLFKQQVTAAQWEGAVKAARGPLGKLQSRQVKSADYKKTLPGVPDGEYVVIQYESAFENKKSATETVTPMKDKDGRWRVAGYYIR